MVGCSRRCGDPRAADYILAGGSAARIAHYDQKSCGCLQPSTVHQIRFAYAFFSHQLSTHRGLRSQLIAGRHLQVGVVVICVLVRMKTAPQGLRR